MAKNTQSAPQNEAEKQAVQQEAQPEAPASANAESENAKRVAIQFAGTNELGKTQAYAAPPSGIKGIQIVHNPADDLPTESYKLTRAELEKHPELMVQLAFFGASVHLRNQINTEKDEQSARNKLRDRLDGFKNGVYRAIGEGSETVPLIIRAFEKAITDAKWPAEKITAKVDEYLTAWHSADKKGKAEIREKLKSNAQVRDAMVALTTKPKKEAEEVGLGDL